MITRRQLLLVLAAAAGAPAALLDRSYAFGDASKFTIAELDLGGGTIPRPAAWTRLLAEVRATTSVETRDVQPGSIPRLRPLQTELFQHPFVVCAGNDSFPIPQEDALEQLSRFLAYGGFILFDDTTGSGSSGFERSVRQLASVLFPTRGLSTLPKSHSIYRAFFLLERPLGRVARFDDLEGVTVGGVRVEGERREDTTNTPLILMRNDLSGALARNRAGRNENPVVPGGEQQRREAVKLGINLVMYCLTANYKKDQVHVKELIERNRVNPSGFGFPR
ncbi:MAG: DUF4159 domain-containing protein [Deltaproteobacteria bacterium]|nr:MAG: DUF4159 domain-containing protein [Deltaproteobacteria bacterium]